VSGALPFLLIVIFALAGAWRATQLWRGRAARLTVLGIVSFALLVLGAHLLATIAAFTRRPVIGPWTLAVAVGALAVAVGLAVRRVEARRRGEAGGGRAAGDVPAARGWIDPAAAVAAVVCGGFLANAAVLGLSGPPRGWDVMTYHLPRAVAWLQHGNLGHYGFSPAFYPGNAEVLLLTTLFTGSDRFATIVQLPFALLGSVAVYGIARMLGARVRSSIAGALVFCLAPFVFFQSGIAKNDLLVAAMVLAGSFLLLRAVGARVPGRVRRLDLVLSGLAFGLAVGTKYTILSFVAATVPVVLLAAARPRYARGAPGTGAWGRAFRATGIFVLAIALPSAFWFVQNWVAAGNPFAPVSVGIGGWTVFEGLDVASTFGDQQFIYVPRASAWVTFPWFDRAFEGSYSGSVGFGAAFATFLVPSLGLLVWRARRGRSEAIRLRSRVLLALAAVGIAGWWVGGFHLPRYLWPTLALLCAPVALVFDEVPGKGKIALVVLLAVAGLFSSLESLRIVHDSRHFVTGKLPGRATKPIYYNMPDLIYELPPGTRILLLQVGGESYHRTFRYPLVGDLPGNDVIMVGDVGIDLEVAVGDTAATHAVLRSEGVEYVFRRTLTMLPRRTWFDDFPARYEKVHDTAENPYPWHRVGIVRQRADGRFEGFPTVTTIYRVRGE